MRNIIVSMNVTADGFMSGLNGELNWHFNFWDDEMCECVCEQLYHADALLLGKNTYNALARYWPYKVIDQSMPRGDIILADMMNRHQKIVCSHTLTLLPWANSSLLRGDLKQRIEELKQTDGRNIITYGSGQLIASLLKEDLIDRFELWTHPVRIRSGIPLFRSRHAPRTCSFPIPGN